MQIVSLTDNLHEMLKPIFLKKKKKKKKTKKNKKTTYQQFCRPLNLHKKSGKGYDIQQTYRTNEKWTSPH